MDKQDSHCCLRVPEEVRRQKRKELDARRSKCRIRIGSHLDQWCDLKEELGFSLHSQLAKFLLDSYSSSTAMLGTEQPNEDELPASFSVTFDALQQLIILCHGHSQDCKFLPNLKLSTPQKRRGLVQALLWECLAGHTFSWSFTVSTRQHDAPQICPRTTDTEKNAQMETSNEQRSFTGSQRIPPVRQSRRLRSAVSSRKLTPIEMVQSSESAEAVTAPQNAFDASDCSSISIEQRQEESQGTTPREVAVTGLCDFTYNNVHLSSEDTGVQHPGSWPASGEQDQKRVTRPCQRTVSLQDAPAKKQRTEPIDVPAQSPSAVQEANAADSPTAAERMVAGYLSPSSEASAKVFLSVHCLSLEANEESTMPGFCTTPEDLQPDAAVGLSVEKSAAVLGQDMLRDGTESHKDPSPFIDAIQEENFQPPSHREKQRLEQSDKEQPQIVKKKVRKLAKKEIIQCDYEGCDKIFSNRQYLNHHKKYQHVNRYTFTCSDPKCGKSFNFKKHLKEHEKRHTDKRDFICEFCARAFRTSSNLVIHRRIHTGEKPLQCEICGVTCRQKASLNWHMKKHDADSFYLFSCDTCGKRFEKRDNVTAHKAKKHPGACMPVESQEIPVNQYDMPFWKPSLSPTTQLCQEAQVQSLEGD